MLSVTEALAQIARHSQPGRTEMTRLADSLGLTLAESINATADSPPFAKSMMDGFAVRSADISAAETVLSVVERTVAGQVPQKTVGTGEAIQVMTGTAVPAGCDAVIPVEQLEDRGETISVAISSIGAGRNIMRQGESMQSGETVLPAGRPITPAQLALLAELGQFEVEAWRRPQIAVLATGNELVPVNRQPGPGQIRNSNEPMLTAQIQSAGATPQPLGIARDEHDELKAKIEAGLQSDFLILSGGVSAGVLDLVPQVLAECGVEQVFHKVKLKPGKPIWFGVRPESEQGGRCLVFGLPGNPVSSLVCFELFVKPALRLVQGLENSIEPLQAELTQAHLVKGDRPVYHPARWQVENGKLTAQPTRWVGSADLRGTAEANGMIHFSPREATYECGETVELFPWFTTPDLPQP